MNYEFELSDKAGMIFIDKSDQDTININFRYGQLIDNHFEEYSWDGHYRCEIFKGNIIYEGLPKTTSYDIIRKQLDIFFNDIDKETYNIIINAYSLNKNKPERF